MQQYPSIEGSSKAPVGKSCIAFYKYDGSNLRWEWNPKKGWFKFGTRTQLFDHTHEIFGEAIPIFMDTMADELVRRIKDDQKNPHRITVFTEFLGKNSFAGTHDPKDPKELKLIDAYIFKQGFMNPKKFVNLFGDLSYVAEVIYTGKLNKEFIDNVRKGNYPVWEGVVAKGDDFIVKIKTNAYFQKLNDVYGKNYKLYWE